MEEMKRKHEKEIMTRSVNKDGYITYKVELTDGKMRELETISCSSPDDKFFRCSLNFFERVISREQEERMRTQERLAELEKKYEILWDFFQAKMRWDVNVEKK